MRNEISGYCEVRYSTAGWYLLETMVEIDSIESTINPFSFITPLTSRQRLSGLQDVDSPTPMVRSLPAGVVLPELLLLPGYTPVMTFLYPECRDKGVCSGGLSVAVVTTAVEPSAPATSRAISFAPLEWPPSTGITKFPWLSTHIIAGSSYLPESIGDISLTNAPRARNTIIASHLGHSSAISVAALPRFTS